MRFYTRQHRFFCGIDLHARSMFLCILDRQGNVLIHRNIKANSDDFLNVVAPFREDVAVAVECIFSWYWLADLCAREKIPFILGHALYMKAIHGGKSKNDKIDALKIATLLRGGMIPQAYAYPAQMRSTRDLLRRRMHLVHKRAELLAHIQNTTSQYNLPEFEKVIAYKNNRTGLAERFPDPTVRTSIAADLELIDHYDDLLKRLELFILRSARVHDPNALMLLRSVPGIGKILSLVILYEIHDVARFPSVQDFASYSRLVRCSHTSAGKRVGSGGRKIGNAHLKWAFSEAAVLFLRGNPQAQDWLARTATKHGKPKALSILAHKLGRTVYHILTKERAFDMNRFLAD